MVSSELEGEALPDSAMELTVGGNAGIEKSRGKSREKSYGSQLSGHVVIHADRDTPAIGWCDRIPCSAGSNPFMQGSQIVARLPLVDERWS